MVIAAGCTAIAGTLVIYLASLSDGVESALAGLVWLSLLAEASPFFVSSVTNRRND